MAPVSGPFPPDGTQHDLMQQDTWLSFQSPLQVTISVICVLPSALLSGEGGGGEKGAAEGWVAERKEG